MVYFYITFISIYNKNFFKTKQFFNILVFWSFLRGSITIIDCNVLVKIFQELVKKKLITNFFDNFVTLIQTKRSKTKIRL